MKQTESNTPAVPQEINPAAPITPTATTSQPHKVLIGPSIPIEDLLGSVTTYNNVEGSESFQLRTSARVFKKMKLDSALALISEKKEPEKKEEQQKVEVKKPVQKPFWTIEDKNYFFEALNEFGKDFEAIHSHINNKIKKRGLQEASSLKTKEQIRHFYYRTWHKISKHLKFSDDVKKVVQELYGLINYGELRKKPIAINQKVCVKLNELIYRGSIAIRYKGKTIRVRTPMCKALRQLNRLEENNDDIKLPTRIMIECKPKDMYTWMKVQEISQNPRIKTLVPLQKRLSSVLAYLTERWKSQEVHEHEKLLSFNRDVVLSTSGDNNVPEPRSDPPLRLAPPSNVNIIVPNINITEFFTSHSICLNAYEERIGAKQSGESLWLAAFPNYKTLIKGAANKRGVKRPRTESSSDKGSCNNNKSLSSLTVTDSNRNCVGNSEGLEGPNVDELIDEAVNTLLSLQQQQESNKAGGSVEEKAADEVKEEDDCLALVKKEHDIANIRLGWTLSDCGTITIGDLYLMFGSDAKLKLEYSFDSVPNANNFKQEYLYNKENVKAEGIKTDNTDNCYNGNPAANPSLVSGTLRQLLSMAKLHYRKNIVKCPCGHICGSSKNQYKGKNIKASNNEPKLVEIQPATTVVTLPQSNVTTTASMVPILIQPEIKKFSPASLFRRPNSPNNGLRVQLDSIKRLMPRYCNRKGRPRTKQLVVERTLPLLASNKADNGQHKIVQMNFVSQESTMVPAKPKPIAPKIVPQIATGTDIQTSFTLAPVSVSANSISTENGNFIPLEAHQKQQQQLVDSQPSTSNSSNNTSIIGADLLDNATTPSRVGSPTSISNLLDLALQSHQNDDGLRGEGAQESSGITSFVGLLSDNNHSSESMPPSPTRILKENDNNWLNSEVCDFSFSSFLGHLESPVKTAPVVSASTLPADETTRLSLTQDMDAQLQSLLTESSLDYTAKFADLAAQVNEANKI